MKVKIIPNNQLGTGIPGFLCSRFGFVIISALFLLCTSFADAQQKTTVRFGHFPNITHAQGVIAHALSRQGKGWFEQRLGPNVEIQWFTYNAGPSAMEAIFAKSLDVTYVGPGPALNAYLKSNGEEIRVISGGANGGAAPRSAA